MHVVVTVLVLLASLLTLVCAIGLALMRDPLQRLHFLSPTAALAAPLLALAVWLDGAGVQSGLKASLIAFFLMLTGSGGSHATARAVRVHQRGHWEPTIEDHVEIVRQRSGKTEVG